MAKIPPDVYKLAIAGAKISSIVRLTGYPRDEIRKWFIDHNIPVPKRGPAVGSAYSNRKIDPIVAMAMRKTGSSYAAIGLHYGVSPQYICKMLLHPVYAPPAKK